MLKISDAANLAFHAMAALTAEGQAPQRSVGQLASYLGVSEHHLAKVMQRLAKVGLVHSRRGPRGGFTLGLEPGQIRLLDIYEAIEGPLPERTCLLQNKVCKGAGCVMGDMLQVVNDQVRDHLSNTTLADMGVTFPPMGGAT